MRKPLLAANWKMHKTIEEAATFMGAFLPLVQEVTEREVVICPTFTGLAITRSMLQQTAVKLGAQNVHWESHGAFTGEISPAMLADAGCHYVIIGHSERRQYFGETDATVNKKIKATFANQLIPVFCVGETLEEREAGKTETIIETQVRDGLAGIDQNLAAKLVVAYEPVWAIGTGKTATSEEANRVCGLIRNIVAGLFGNSVAAAVRILYGGSVKPENAAELMAQSDIDGALVGGASLEAVSFAKIVNY